MLAMAEIPVLMTMRHTYVQYPCYNMV